MKATLTSPESVGGQLGRQARALQGLLSGLLEPPVDLHGHPLSDMELSPREMKVLTTLGDKGEAIMSDLASALRLPLSTATRIIDRLIKKQMVERSRSELDRRIVIVRPADKGRLMNDALRESQFVMAARMLRPLSNGEREILLELIAKMAQGLTAARK